MDIRRTILLVAIAVVGYFMVLSWNQDFGEGGKLLVKDTPVEQSQAAVEQTDNMVPDASQLTPQSPDETPATPTDTPALATDSNSPSGDQTDTSIAPVDDNLIHITTDMFRLAIDPTGGDIVSLDLIQYPVDVDDPDEPFPLLARSKSLNFVLQSGLIGENGTDGGANRPTYKASSSNYVLADDKDSLSVDLVTKQDGVTITKRYTFNRDSYAIQVENLVNNHSDHAWKAAFYGQIKRDNSSDPSLGGKGFTTMATYMGGAYLDAENKYQKLKFDTIEEDGLDLHREGGWIALSQHYFLTAWMGNADQKNQYGAIFKSGTGDKEYYYLRYISPVKTIQPGADGSFSSEVYAGPKIQKRLAGVSKNLDKTIDFGWSWFIAEPIFSLLVFLQSGEITVFGHEYNLGTGVGNWGVAIILLTLIIKLLFFRLSATAYRSMAKMRKLAPEMKRIKNEYKDDRQKQSAAMMKLYKKERINPVGGCLPMIVQAPVFIALYYVLLYSVEIRQAPFFGWINDLSVMDPYFILPIIMGIAMYFQMSLNPQPADNTQAKVMKFMPVAFVFFFLWFPSGLVLYYVTNNVLSIAQQYWITRAIEKS